MEIQKSKTRKLFLAAFLILTMLKSPKVYLNKTLDGHRIATNLLFTYWGYLYIASSVIMALLSLT